MTRMTPERLSSLDASFLYLEKPAQHMHVAAVSLFEPRDDGPLRYDDVAHVIRHRLHLAPRLRQRVLQVPGNMARPVWVDDDRFDIEFHLRRAALPAPGGRAELERAVARVLSRPLDRSKPLWELYVYEGLEHDRTAVLLKLHHALADGIGGMLIASALYDLAADAPLGPPEAQPWTPAPPPSAESLFVEAVEEQFLHPLGSLAHALERPARAARSVAETVAGVGALLGMGPPPPGPFDVAVGPARRFATTEVPFEVLRDIKRARGVTVNDVLLAAIAGGLHDLLRARGGDTAGRTLRVMVPVSVRSRAQAGDVGNRVAPAFVDVPVGRMSARARLERVHAATSVLKGSGMALGVDAIVGLGAYAPGALHATAARLISRGRWFNLVVSNVPAPQVPIYLAGARLLASYPAMPLGERSGLSVACTSLGGTMAFGLTADWDAAPDLHVLTHGIERGVEQLVPRARPARRRATA
jgi:diacylglycerol O-acyltransferase / wax synthase